MESPEWPEPKREVSSYLFLYPFYYLGGRIRGDSPEHCIEMNKRYSDRVARKVFEKIPHLSRVYEEDEFPVHELEDPAGILPALPIRMRFRSPGRELDTGMSVSLMPVIERENTPLSLAWLGRLSINCYREDDIHIQAVELNQPGEGSSITLNRHHGSPGRQAGLGAYPADAQAMNFIGMVDDYIDQLNKGRLVIVRGS